MLTILSWATTCTLSVGCRSLLAILARTDPRVSFPWHYNRMKGHLQNNSNVISVISGKYSHIYIFTESYSRGTVTDEKHFVNMKIISVSTGYPVHTLISTSKIINFQLTTIDTYLYRTCTASTFLIRHKIINFPSTECHLLVQHNKLTSSMNSCLGDSQVIMRLICSPWKEAPWGRMILVVWWFSSTFRT